METQLSELQLTNCPKKNLIMAERYVKLLENVPWSDRFFLMGIQEGLNKFLSNLYLHLCGRRPKCHKAHYVSEKALVKMIAVDYSGLVFEHMIPKSVYIQKPCESMAQKNQISVEQVFSLLSSYWFIATITAEEDKLLIKNDMPQGWDCMNIFYRYESADITLQINPFIEDSA
jgi:hypothetical protein